MKRKKLSKEIKENIRDKDVKQEERTVIQSSPENNSENKEEEAKSTTKISNKTVVTNDPIDLEFQEDSLEKIETNNMQASDTKTIRRNISSVEGRNGRIAWPR
jgi:hypothetical protein